MHELLKRMDSLEQRMKVIEDHREIVSALHGISAQLTRMETSMDANIQRAIDDIANTKDIATSIKSSTALLSDEISGVQSQLTDQATQIADLKAQIAALQAAGNVTPADLISLSDAAAALEQSNVDLTQSATDVADANTKLGTAVPANTSTVGATSKPINSSA